VEPVGMAVEFPGTCAPFLGYIRFCYAERMAAISEVDKTFWKLMMNTLYGKFGQTGGLTMIYDDREIEMATETAHANVIWAAYVTAYARLHLLSLLRQAGDVFYCDTDSVFTHAVLPTGGDLGQLKEEGTYDDVMFYGNKLYVLDGRAKAKGVRREVARDFLRTGQATFRKPVRFRESRRLGAQPNVWYHVTKQLRSEYTKRIIREDQSTAPWEYAAYRRVHLREDGGDG